MIRILSLILVISLITSCNTSNKNNTEPISLKDTIFVKPELLKTDKLFSEIFNIKTYDSILILNSPDGKGFLQLLNKNSGKFISTKCIVGRGPREFSDYVELNVIADSIYIFEPFNNAIYVYKSDTFLNDSISRNTKKIQFEKIKINYDVVPLNGYFVSSTGMGPRFSLFNRNGKHISDYQLFPDYYKDVKSIILKGELLSYFVIEPKPDLLKFVSLSHLGGVLEIFNVEKDSINRIMEKKFLDPELKIEREDNRLMKENTKVGFFGLYTTDNFIYASYSGLAYKDFRKLRTSDYITVFDWNGKLTKLYKVEGGLTALAADEAEGKIYVVTKDSEGVDAVGVIKM